MEAINSQLSFGRAKAAEKTDKKAKTPAAPKPNFVQSAKDAYVKTVNEKYDVDYESMKPDAKKIINKDFFTEKALCVGAAVVTVGAFLSRGRSLVSGFASAAGTSAGKLFHKKGAGFDVNGKEVQGLGGWISSKASSLLHAPKLKETVSATNDVIGDIVSKSRNTSATRFDKAQEAVKTITRTNGLKYKAQVGETINPKNFRGVLNSIQELGEPELAASLEKKLKAQPLSGEEGIKFLDDVAAKIQKLGGQQGSFNASAKEMNALADAVQNNQNPDLAKAIRSFIPEGAKEKDMVSVPLEQFNKTIADNRLTVLPNASKPVEFDTTSGMHKAIKKVFKDDETVGEVEKMLGNKGISNGRDVVDTAIAGGLVLKGGDQVYKAMDDLTDTNDDEVGGTALSKSDEEQLKALQAKIKSKKQHKVTPQEAKLVADLAMNML